jgi:hypothetical protein
MIGDFFGWFGYSGWACIILIFALCLYLDIKDVLSNRRF